MTFEEAKKILEKEGFELEKRPGKSHTVSTFFTEYESSEICEAMQVVSSADYAIKMLVEAFNARKARLKKEFEEPANAPVSGKEKAKEKKGIIYPSTFPKADFYYKHVLNEGNPALEESASQFNDALLDEQAKKIKRLGKEISKLNSIIHDKNAVLSDVAEELRLTKIREKNLAELCLKYVGENEKLNEKLKSINMNRHNERICKKQLAEKDEVIADLGNELAATKTELEEKTKLVEVVRKGSKEYCEYGIAAEKMIQKMAKVIVGKGLICSEDFEKYRLWANGYRFNPQLPDFSEEEEKKLSLFRDDSVGAVTNQKDCSHVKDTHPTEDNPEEIDMDEILEYVRKALEKGHTVSIDYDKAEEGGDQSATIVECGKDIEDVFEEIKRLCQE